jgi:hypothetical protein
VRSGEKKFAPNEQKLRTPDEEVVTHLSDFFSDFPRSLAKLSPDKNWRFVRLRTIMTARSLLK